MGNKRGIKAKRSGCKSLAAREVGKRPGRDTGTTRDSITPTYPHVAGGTLEGHLESSNRQRLAIDILLFILV